MGKRYSLFRIAASLILLIAGCGCNSATTSPKELLDKYFSSAIRQEYDTTYACYYAAYKAKVSKEEYIKHRKEGSALQSYKIISLKQESDAAHAEVALTFCPFRKIEDERGCFNKHKGRPGQKKRGVENQGLVLIWNVA